jgi:glutathione S-transferase
MAERSTETLNQLMEAVTAKFRIADDVLRNQPFMAGDALTLADFPLAAALYRYNTMGLDRTPLAGIDAYYDRLTNHAPYRDNVMISYESLRTKT